MLQALAHATGAEKVGILVLEMLVVPTEVTVRGLEGQ